MEDLLVPVYTNIENENKNAKTKGRYECDNFSFVLKNDRENPLDWAPVKFGRLLTWAVDVKTNRVLEEPFKLV